MSVREGLGPLGALRQGRAACWPKARRWWWEGGSWSPRGAEGCVACVVAYPCP